jgi:ASC-1-like (ASCH) protein
MKEEKKTWILRFKAKDKKNFDEVKNGSKPIETRAATVRYQPIEVGDVLEFVCGKEHLRKTVTKKQHFASIDAMIKKIPYQNIMPSVQSVEEMKKAYASYSGYEEKIKEFGIFAFKLK